MPRQWTSDKRPVGDRLAPKIAVLVEHVLTEHLRKSSHHRAKIGTQAALDFFKTIEDERNEYGGDLLAALLGHEDTPPELEKLLQFIHHGHGELSSILASQVLGATIGTGLGAGIANLLAPLNQRIMQINPHQILPPGQLAALVATGILPAEDALLQAQRSGLPHEKTEQLIQAAYQWPALPDLLELFRRGEITGEEFDTAMVRQGVPTGWTPKLFSLRREHLSIADAALAVLRGAISEDEGLEIAAVNGYTKKDFETFTYNTGEPPGLEQLLEAYRREFINKDRLDRGIRQSRVRNEWSDVVEKLRFSPASPADAIRGAVQGHISTAEAKRICEQGGLEPSAFEWMFETAGNPPGTQQMVTLYVRGKMTKAQLEQGIRESRYKDKYIQQIIDLKRKIPSIFQINTLLKSGSISEAEGARLLTESGYEKDISHAIVHAAASGAVVKEKHLAKAEVMELYEDKALTEAQALGSLEALGYHTGNAKLILRLVELKREKTLRNAAIAPIKTEYVNRRIEEKEAQAALDALALPHEQVTYVLALWTIERDTHTKFLSEAQVVKANTLGLISDDEAEKRLQGLGYPHEDAKLLLDMEKGRRVPAP